MARRRGPRRVRFGDSSEQRIPAEPVNEMPDLEAPDFDVPDGVLQLRSADGDIFQVPAAILVRESSVIRGIVEDSGLEEEVPLPGISSRALARMVDYCATAAEGRRLQILPAMRALPPTPQQSALARTALAVPVSNPFEALDLSLLLELRWAARLLDLACVRGAALCALGRMAAQRLGGAPAPISVQILIEVVRDYGGNFPSQEVVTLLNAMVGAAAHDCVPEVVKVLNPYVLHKSQAVRTAAGDALIALGSSTALLPLLEHQDGALRCDTARRLLRFAEAAPHQAEELLGSSLWQAREIGARGLAGVAAPAATSVVEILGSMLEDNAREVRNAVVSTLRRVTRPGDQRVIAIAIRHLGSSKWPVACSAMGLLSTAANDPALVKAVAATVAQKSGATLMQHAVGRSLRRMELEPAAPLEAPRQCAWADAVEDDDEGEEEEE